MKKSVRDLSDEELTKAWEKGSKWLKSKMQVSNDSKSEDGEPYDHTLFVGGLDKLAKIENELIRRGLKYGQ